MTIYIMDQTLPRIHNPYEPFAFTDVATEAAGKLEQVYCHFWQLSDTMILGMKDTRLPFLIDGLQVLKEAGYDSIIRNSGGLGVINDAGILNVSLIFPKHLAATTDAAYEMMATLLQTAFPERTILAYEIADSYCPGTYDLSIDGKNCWYSTTTDQRWRGCHDVSEHQWRPTSPRFSRSSFLPSRFERALW